MTPAGPRRSHWVTSAVRAALLVVACGAAIALSPGGAIAAAPTPSVVGLPPAGIGSPSAAPSPGYASTPAATPAVEGDPRSSGEGAGLVGAPLFALGGMLGVGLLAAALTLVYVRLTGGPRPD